MFESPGSITGNQPISERYYNSPACNDAVNAARFVKGFGITARVDSILLLPGIGLRNECRNRRAELPAHLRT